MAIRVYPLTGVPRVNVGGYGPRTKNGVTKLHDAVDLEAPTGTPVVAVDDGVARWGVDPKGGNVATVTFADGSAAYFAHMLDVQSGSRQVKAGDQIGRCDTSGNAALVGIPHVHFQIFPNGHYVQGQVCPDPTAALWAAPVLAAPNGPSRVGAVLAAIFGAAALLGLGYGAAYAWDHR